MSATEVFVTAVLVHFSVVGAHIASPTLERHLLWAIFVTTAVAATAAAYDRPALDTAVWVAVGAIHARTLARAYEMDLHRRLR